MAIPTLRRYRPEDFDALVLLWHETMEDAYPYLELHTLTQDVGYFAENIVPTHDVWVAEIAGRLAGFLAIRESYIDRLYIHPRNQRCGIGTALLQRAQQLRPDGLELCTHQKNTPACEFYEKHEFTAVRFGLSPPPESEPDVEYHWRP